MIPLKDNWLLSSLAAEDVALLQPHLKNAHLAQRQILFREGDALHSVYFPLSAVISLVTGLSTGQSVETAMVGRDGVVAAGAALDGKIGLSTAVAQLGGDALTCSADALKAAALQSAPLLSVLVRYEQTLLAQAQQSAACLAGHSLSARLCRWLLRARDLAGSDNLPFTQEYLAEMLGVSRTSVTVEAHTLQQAGSIRYSRGKIEIVDVESIKDCACECYSAVNERYEQLFPASRD